jgi:hypothetical protein
MPAPEMAWYPSTPRVRRSSIPAWDASTKGRGHMGDRGGRSVGHGAGHAWHGGAQGGGQEGVWKEGTQGTVTRVPRKWSSGDSQGLILPMKSQWRNGSWT